MTVLARNSVLDAVRGVAILQVFAWHFVAPLAAKRLGAIGSLFSLTWSGVDLFFVLSGFLIGGILIRNRDAKNYFRVFYARRVLRIAPLYILTMAIFFSLQPEAFGPEYLGMYQNFVWAARDTFGPGAIAATWSLAVEEQFYVALPLVVRFCRPRYLPYVCAALIICAPLFRLACHLAGYPHAAYLLLPARMDALLFGVLIAWAHNAGYQDRVGSIARALIIPFGLAMLALILANRNSLDPVMSVGGCTIIAIFYTCVVALVAPLRGRLAWPLRPLGWTGLGAYSIYLFHSMIGGLSYSIFGPHPLAFLGMAVGLSATALICWKTIEAPLIAYGHARFRYRRV
ncbi:MAG: acyltransferase [Sphingomonas bacterium]